MTWDAMPSQAIGGSVSLFALKAGAAQARELQLADRVRRRDGRLAAHMDPKDPESSTCACDAQPRGALLCGGGAWPCGVRSL